ncbi:xylulokinase [Halobacillus salinarum]|uniref:Xylulose kinase n=1 Tax=Halobacillus salinarum TaxID=2932257 RepID=A0ABY4EKG3_9BACI|nr:xylulokinase [Halobacillus salinarum]UOQ44027.1 xylulokinase [Halobacillus salinarum]
MKYVIGVDLGTSAVKVLLVNQAGRITKEVSKSYPLIQEKTGYSEQDPEQWVEKTLEGLKELTGSHDVNPADIEGISFAGQMHGLVLLDRQQEVLRHAILWNDTRTTEQCRKIYQELGEERLLTLTKNPALEGFTLPKLLWVKENEREIYNEASTFLLPKDYLRYRLTGRINCEYSDAAGTLLLDTAKKEWSSEICDVFELPVNLCPPLVDSGDCVGTLTEEAAQVSGLSENVKVFAGGADNACGAIGAGILSEGKTLCSIGTSGVVLSYEDSADLDFSGKVHYFNHGKKDAFYTMGVTLSAGYSLSWFKQVFASEESYEELLQELDAAPLGAGGLLFTPYLAGERTPHADADIRGSFIGMDSAHTKKDFVRSVVEGITFSLNDSIQIFREQGKTIDKVVSIGGGAKNDTWLQIQADIFNAQVVRLESEQGPGMGAAMLAACGCGWFSTLEECAGAFVEPKDIVSPVSENVVAYRNLYRLYQEVYTQTKEINKGLAAFRT